MRAKAVFFVHLFVLLALFTGCSRHHEDRRLARYHKRCPHVEQDLWQYGRAMDDEFVSLDEQDRFAFSEETIAQSKYIPGQGGVPALNRFQDAVGALSQLFRTVYFNTDDHVLRKQEYVEIIDRISEHMKSHPNMMLAIMGHCDERGSESYNLALGTKRANYVRSLLVQRGIDPNRVYTSSYGKEKPVDFGHGPNAWAKNRRAEFKLHE